MDTAPYQSHQEIICETPTVRIAEITLPAHSDTPDHQHTEAEEICYCLQGELTCEIGNGRTVLQPGDKMRFAATHHHRLRNLASRECRFLLIHGGGTFDFIAGSRTKS